MFVMRVRDFSSGARTDVCVHGGHTSPCVTRSRRSRRQEKPGFEASNWNELRASQRGVKIVVSTRALCNPPPEDEEWIRPPMIDLSKRVYKAIVLNKLHQLPSTGHSSFHRVGTL